VTDEPRDLGAYCREIESYLCRKNGGHLIRIVGPAFELVGGWRQRGVPLKIVFRGIDRVVERRLDRGSRRPIRIEFCEADVNATFDDWKRAVGRLANVALPDDESDSKGNATADDGEAAARTRGPSLPAHLERAQVRLSSLLASQSLPDALRARLEQTMGRVDALRGEARTARGDARARILAELRELDTTLVADAWAAQNEGAHDAWRQEAASDLDGFRGRLAPAAWQATVDAAARRVMREKLGLPVIAFDA
jgi:hypothetical protein